MTVADDVYPGTKHNGQSLDVIDEKTLLPSETGTECHRKNSAKTEWRASKKYRGSTGKTKSLKNRLTLDVILRYSLQ